MHGNAINLVINIHIGKHDENMLRCRTVSILCLAHFSLELIVALISFATEIIYVWHPWRATLTLVVAVAMAQGIHRRANILYKHTALNIIMTLSIAAPRLCQL